MSKSWSCDQPDDEHGIPEEFIDPAVFKGVDSGERNGEDRSFKESFYSSGTDWSCLYAVDDYGLPYESIGEREILEIDVAKSGSGCYEEVFGGPGSKGLCGKLVQSTLAACWGNASKPMAQPLCTETAMKDPKRVAGAHFKQPSVFASPALGGGRSPWNAARGQGNAKAVAATGRICPFYKKIPGTSFTVDAFRYGAVHGCLAYFLTHFHSDHYGGLTKSWSHGPIYCTPVTARLLVLCLSVNERWIYPVPLGTTRIIQGVQVKFLEANHCPGAAIILFCLKNGQSILHTGDFRACKEMQSYPELTESRINVLFLDTTYCNPRYRFPSQKEVIDFVIQITQENLKKNSRTLVVVGAYSIGKERVYLGIAEALETSIFVEKRRNRILMALEWPELAHRLCADAGSTMLHVLPIGFLRPQRLKAYLQDFPRFNSVLAFRPTGWTYSEKIGNQLHLLKPAVAGPVTIYGVPYSEHSSFNELRQFVQFLRPEKVIPTVNNGRPQEREKMQSHFRQWLMKQD